MTLLTADANEGFGITTAQIIYRMPDRQALLQEFLWQHHDVFPHFPLLEKFLEFWEREIEGPIHQVIVAHVRLIRPVDLLEMRKALH